MEGIYQWAGRYRQVDLTKGSLTFASVRQIPRLMTEFEAGPLKTYTPCIFQSLDEVAEALAVVHVELILIHPFREGNGRTARLLSILMAAQAELPVLDFGLIRGKRRKSYFAAVMAGLNRDYEPRKSVFRSIISGTLKFH